MNILLLFILFSYKFIKSTLIYNALIFPFLIYLFTSRESRFANKNLSINFFIIFEIINFSFFIFSQDNNWSLINTFSRSISLTIFYLSIFGLLPFNKKLFNIFLLPILFSLPAIFFIKDPPLIFSYSSESSFIGSTGLLSGTSLAGLFPTSFYFAQLLTSYLLYFNYLIVDNVYPSLTSIKNKTFDRFVYFVLLTFTNRKAFLFPFFFSFLSELTGSFRSIFNTKKIKKLKLFLLIFSTFLISAIYISVKVSFPNISVFGIFQEIFNRIIFYGDWAINPDNYDFYETSIMIINKVGGKVIYYLTFFLLFLSLILKFKDITKSGLSKFIIAYSFIFLFLFKEAATIFSPSPSALILMMTISAILNSLNNNKFLIF